MRTSTPSFTSKSLVDAEIRSGSAGSTRSAASSCPPFTGGGRTVTLGGMVQFSFPRTRGGTDSAYHVFLGAEELWLKQTSDADPQAPYLSLRRLSLTFGLGMALWQ